MKGKFLIKRNGRLKIEDWCLGLDSSDGTWLCWKYCQLSDIDRWHRDESFIRFTNRFKSIDRSDLIQSIECQLMAFAYWSMNDNPSSSPNRWWSVNRSFVFNTTIAALASVRIFTNHYHILPNATEHHYHQKLLHYSH